MTAARKKRMSACHSPSLLRWQGPWERNKEYALNLSRGDTHSFGTEKSCNARSEIFATVTTTVFIVGHDNVEVEGSEVSK